MCILPQVQRIIQHQNKCEYIQIRHGHNIVNFEFIHDCINSNSALFSIQFASHTPRAFDFIRFPIILFTRLIKMKRPVLTRVSIVCSFRNTAI